MGRGKASSVPLMGRRIIWMLTYRYRPARLDRPENEAIATILVRSLTAICFKMFNFHLEFLVLVQSSKPLNTKCLQSSLS